MDEDLMQTANKWLKMKLVKIHMNQSEGQEKGEGNDRWIDTARQGDEGNEMHQQSILERQNCRWLTECHLRLVTSHLGEAFYYLG